MMQQFIAVLKKDYFMTYIYVYTFLMPWNFFNAQMGILTICLFVWWSIIGKKRGYFSQLKAIISFTPLVLLLSFFLFSYLTLLWTDNFSDAVLSLKYYNYYWLMLPVLFTSLSAEEAKKVIYILVASFGSYALFSILIYLNVFEIAFNSQKNPRGILPYAVVTPYMAIGLLISMIIFITETSKKMKVFYLLLSVLLFVGLFINQGRAAQLAFFCTLVILMGVYLRSSLSVKNIMILGSVLVLSFLALAYFEKLDRFLLGMEQIYNAQENNFSGSWGERVYMWYIAADILKVHYMLGIGAGDAIDAIIRYGIEYPSEASWVRGFHNQHLDFLVKYGLVGYGLFLSSVVVLLWKVRKVSSQMFYIALAFFLVVLIDGIADVLLTMKPFNNIFMLVFIVFSVLILKKERMTLNNTVKGLE